MKDELYAAASAFAELSLWSVLSEREPFAVRSGEELLYCSVRELDEGVALLVFHGEDAFERLCRELHTAYPKSVPNLLSPECLIASVGPRARLREEDIEEITALGINFKGRTAWPLYRKLEYGRYPWFVNEREDRIRLLDSLNAAVFLSHKLESSSQLSLSGLGIGDSAQSKEALGFSDVLGDAPGVPLLEPEGVGYKIGVLHPSFSPRQAPAPAEPPKNGFRGWKAGFALLPELAAGEPPFLPRMLLLLDENDRYIASFLSESKAGLVNRLAGLIKSSGEARDILACDDEAFGLLEQLGEEARSSLYRGSCEKLEVLVKAVLRHFSQPEGFDEAVSEFDRLRRMKRAMRRGGLETVRKELNVLLEDMPRENALFPGSHAYELRKIASALCIKGCNVFTKDVLLETLERVFLSREGLYELLSIPDDEAYKLLLKVCEQPVALDERYAEETCISLCFLGLAYMEQGSLRVRPKLAAAIKSCVGEKQREARARRRLVTNYIIAAVNLYGVCEKSFICMQFNSREAVSLSRDELEKALAPHAGGMPGSIINADSEYVFHREYPLGSDTLAYLLKQQGEREYYVPRGSFSAFADPSHYERSPQAKALAEFTRCQWKRRWRDALGTLLLCQRRGYVLFDALDMLSEEHGLDIDEGDAAYSELCGLYSAAAAQTGLWRLRGNKMDDSSKGE